MKVKINVKKDQYDKYKEMLENAGFTISDDADFEFKELNIKKDTFIGKIEDRFEIVPFNKIIYIESFGHAVFIHTLQEKYLVKERLYEVENSLQDKNFIRVSKSTIVNKFGIKEMIPAMNSRLNLIMKNGDVVYVSRSYLQLFKAFIGF